MSVISPIHGDICFFQLSNGAGCSVQWDSWRRFQGQSLGGHKEPETTTQNMFLFSPPMPCAHPSTVCKLLLTLYHLMLTMRKKKGSGKLKLPKAIKQGPGQGWDTPPHRHLAFRIFILVAVVNVGGTALFQRKGNKIACPRQCSFKASVA